MSRGPVLALVLGAIAALSLAAQTGSEGSIAGRVLNSVTGAPVRKALVRLNPEGDAPLMAGETDADGRFQFTGLPAGKYWLSAHHAGFTDRTYGARPNLQFGPPFVLAPAEHRTDVDIKLPPLGAISGRVLDEDGDPIAEAFVTILKQTYRNGRKEWNQISGAMIDDRGEFRVSNLAPGKYLVAAGARGRVLTTRFRNPGELPEKPEMIYVPAFYPNATTTTAASVLDLASGADLQGIDIHVSKAPSFHVRGIVTGQESAGPGTVNVQVSPRNGDPLAFGSGAAIQQPGGRFDIAGVVAGQYTLAVIAGSGQNHTFSTQDLAVTGNVTGLVLSIPPPFDLPGQVTLAESGARVKLADFTAYIQQMPGRYTRQEAQADATGKFILKGLSPGRYWIYFGGIPDGCFVQSMRLGGQEVSPDDFLIQSVAPLEVVLSNTAAKLTGTATDSDGKPVFNPALSLVGTEKDAKAIRPSMNSDTFTFNNIKPGTYKLFAWEDIEEGAWEDPDFRKKYEDRAIEIKIGPNETKNVQIRAIMAGEMK